MFFFILGRKAAALNGNLKPEDVYMLMVSCTSRL
jgi:hypothetical protein